LLQFTKLRIAGFKSFVDQAELLIEPGLTGIVGPNGCGKSNLIEALRWVMGETSAKQMRGGEMDDVIFAGSAERPGRNFAEVVVELDNGARAAPAPYGDEQELLVSRRIERAKGSVYRVNGREVRARDVHLLLADAATGARSAALVTQGQVAQMIAAKPAERRALLEEAAGIVGLHARRHEAELRLQSAEANLRRVDDVLSTLDVQRQQLKKQARQASRYRNISSQIRALEATILWLRWRSAETSHTVARGRLADAERAVAAATGASAATATHRIEVAAALPDLRQHEAEAGATVQRLAVELDLLETEERQAARDGDAARARSQQIVADLARERALVADATASMDRLAAERARLVELRAGEASALAVAKEALAEASSGVVDLEARTLGLTERVAAERAGRSALQANRDEAAGQLRRLAARREETMRQRQAALVEAESLTDAAAAEATLAACEAAAAEARQALDRAEAERVRLATDEAAAASELRAAETTFARLAAEEKALAEMLAAGPTEGSRALLDAIAVDAGCEAAFTAVLGDDLLAPEDEQAPARWRTLPPYAEADAPPLPDGASPLAPSVRAPDALARRLRQIGIVDDAAEGERLQFALLPGQRLATRDGAVWRWDGYMRAAGAETPASLRLRQRARLDELRPRRMEAESTCAAAGERHTAARRAAAEAAAAEGRARAQQRAADLELARARHVLADAQSKRTRIDSRLAALAEALATIEADHREAEARADALAAELAALPDGRDEQRMLDELRAELSRLRSSQMERQARVDALVRDASGRARRLQAVEAEIASWTARLDGMRRQIEAIVERQRETAEEMQRVEALPPVLAERRRQLLERSSAADAERRASADRLLAAEAQLADTDRSLRVAEKALADAREDRVRAEAQREQAEQVMHGVARTIADRLGSGPEKLAELVGAVAEDLDMADQERRLDRLRRERELMGPVNLRAEEEASDLEAQIAELDRQRIDLLEAIGKLRRGVAELGREGRERLRASFAEIDRHFQALFQRLFGGGRAHLTLTESDDPLEAGLEIMASPPGKKLQLMSLLSGGEQTLTAVALRFAMFLTRPAPICVLDEVDAALDDANVDRFCSLLSELARGGTRFLVITHHRLTMARMDRLFGVTMQEKGASRLVSVDLMRAEVLRQTG
jgi:chromosome segregation protein